MMFAPGGGLTAAPGGKTGKPPDCWIGAVGSSGVGGGGGTKTGFCGGGSVRPHSGRRSHMPRQPALTSNTPANNINQIARVMTHLQLTYCSRQPSLARGEGARVISIVLCGECVPLGRPNVSSVIVGRGSQDLTIATTMWTGSLWAGLLFCQDRQFCQLCGGYPDSLETVRDNAV